MTSTSVLSVFRAEGRYGLSYNGSPLMASTTDPARVLEALDKWIANFTARRTAYEIAFWDGDKGEETRDLSRHQLVSLLAAEIAP